MSSLIKKDVYSIDAFWEKLYHMETLDKDNIHIKNLKTLKED
jgi:hypothetical protein